MTDIPLPWPANGLSDLTAESQQPQGTTSLAKNVRNIVPSTGRAQGAQRAGMRKYNPSMVVSGTPVQRIAQVVAAQRHFRWEARPQAKLEPEWEGDSAGASVPLDMATTRGDEVWVVDGSHTAVLLNADGEEVHRLELPLEDSGGEVTCCETDDYGNVFFGVGAGSDQDEAKCLGYKPSLDQGFVLLWELDLGGWVKRMRWVSGQLFLLVDDEEEWASTVQIWDAVDSGTPLEGGSMMVAYPGSDLDVRDNKVAYVASEPFTNRWKYPDSPALWGRRLIGWTPDEIDTDEITLWSWFDAGDLDLEDGDEVTIWEDKTDRKRSMRRPDATYQGPIYVEKGIGGLPSLRFEAGEESFLESDASANADPEVTDTHRGFIPAHTNTGYAIYAVIRFTDDATPGTILEWGDSGAVGRLSVNYDYTGSTTDAGRLSWMPDDVTGDELYTTMNAGRRTAVVAMVFNGKSGTGTANSALDFNGLESDTNAPTTGEAAGKREQRLGSPVSPGSDEDAYASFEIAELIVLGRKDPENLTIPFVVDAATHAKILGYLHWKWRLDEEIDSTHAYVLAPPEGEDTSGLASLLGVGGLLARYKSAPGNLSWAIDGDGQTIGALGYACRAGIEDDVFSLGVKSGTDTVTLRRIIDNGEDGYSTSTGDGAWSKTLGPGGFDPTSKNTRLAVDQWGNVFAPWQELYSPTLLQYSLYAYAQGGTALFSYKRESPLGVYANGYTVSLPYLDPDYREDKDFTVLGPGKYERPQYLFLGTGVVNTAGAETVQGVLRVDIVEKETIDVPPRVVRSIAVAGGVVKRFDTGSMVTVSGGESGPSSESRFIGAAAMFGKIYLTDGYGYFVYDAIEDTLANLTAAAGKIPEGFQLIAPWGGRLVMARTADEPHLWTMSRLGDAEDWDFYPAEPTPDQAVFGTLSRASLAPIPITAIIPFSDDVLLFGGDRALWRMRGDPGQGGYFDELADNLGITFGMPWCKTDEGALIVFGSPFGSIYMVVPDGPPRRISKYTIERRLQSVNLETHRVEMAWDHLEEGVRVMIVPQTASATALVTHFFWDSKFDAWFEDEFPASMAPWCLEVMDGDSPEDRCVVAGCADGYIRRFHPEQRDDDGTAIQSRVLLGPHQDGGGVQTTKINSLDITLASKLDGCQWRIYTADTSDGRTTSSASGLLRSGRNGLRRPRVRGAYTWLELLNTEMDESWALESAILGAQPGGRRRAQT